MVNLTRIAPELPASNLEKSIHYYEHKLGFQLAMQLPTLDYAIVERDDIAIHLFQDETQSHTPVGLHIFTQDLDALYAELERRNAHLSQQIQRKPWGNRDFRVKDDFGNEIKFTEPLPPEESLANAIL